MSEMDRRGSMSIMDRPLSKGRKEVSLSAFSFLFSELVQYCQSRIESIADLESKLESVGHSIGLRVLELLIHREKASRREIRLIGALQFVSTVVWQSLFNKGADSLERSMENTDEYMIHEATPLTNQFVSVPREMGQFNCAAFIAGIIRGVLDASGFPCQVSAHNADDGSGSSSGKSVFLIKFAPEVMVREGELGD